MRSFLWLNVLMVYLARESRVESSLVSWTYSVRTLQSVVNQFYHNSCSYQLNVSASCGFLVRQFSFSFDKYHSKTDPTDNDGDSPHYRVCCDLWNLKQCLRNGLYESGCEYSLQRNLTNFNSPVYFNLVFGEKCEIDELCSKYPEKSTNCMEVSSLVVTVILAMLTIFFSFCFLAILFCMFI